MKIWFQNKRSKFKKSQRKGSKKSSSADRDGEDGGNFSEEDEDLNEDDISDSENEHDDESNSSDKTTNIESSDIYQSSTETKTELENNTRSSSELSDKSDIKKEHTDSGISETSSPSLTLSNPSITPPLGIDHTPSQWISPYASNSYENTSQKENHYGQGFYNLGMPLLQPLSASSPASYLNPNSKLSYIHQSHQVQQHYSFPQQQQQQFYTRNYPAYNQGADNLIQSTFNSHNNYGASWSGHSHVESNSFSNVQN